jgi:4a-hydroxytetrahydrobiopterin dehydratase
MAEQLSEMKCVPCSGDEPRATKQEIAEYRQEVPKWEIVEEEGVNKLRRTFDFKNFRQALSFTNAVGEVAEEEDHHPTLVTEWGKTNVTWWTHAISGLHRNDFIMAAKTDELYD